MSHRKRNAPPAVGDLVRIYDAVGSVVGRVLEARTTGQLPDMPNQETSFLAKGFIKEMGIDQLLLIEHAYRGNQQCFWALHCPAGWRDLKGQALRVERMRPGATQ